MNGCLDENLDEIHPNSLIPHLNDSQLVMLLKNHSLCADMPICAVYETNS